MRATIDTQISSSAAVAFEYVRSWADVASQRVCVSSTRTHPHPTSPLRGVLLLSAGEDTAPARRRVDDAKRGLGERGPPWWQDGAPDFNRRMVANTPYAEWHAALDAAPTEAAPAPDKE